MFDETEAFWVPAGYLDEPYNVDLQKVLRHLRDNGTIFLAAVDNGFEEWKKL